MGTRVCAVAEPDRPLWSSMAGELEYFTDTTSLFFIGAWFQYIYTATCPIDNLFAHLADPSYTNHFN
ncbi:hypothetical protein JHK82_054752 [Glycine max]|uniref:Chlorophyll a-b binding protein, chloroplastic n=2 Tax=Glycine subgen. Soja TaxID=1462606 RepID=K7N0G1_SOYBN|nr:hypothetical protein JHK86_054603 [Glycine max]KAG4917107.1 hypothetical protein JHK87_054664 [Glycine soja]KAG4929073.1 hypothetical protein JHK85_055559 [Glycine max]KAG5084583.1 hypothetical protein JHK84_054621 [Glycine max]KAG5087355.1 hypothetical protein JHK82_054752 [Glycine max]